MPTVHDLADHLAGPLDRARYHAEGDPAGVWLASDREVCRLGLRLDPGRPPYDWAAAFDAVLLHRPFGLWPARWPDGVGVLAAHGALDDRFAIGPNSEVPAALGLDVDAEPLRRDGAAIGVVARLPEAARLDDVAGRVEAELGGLKARLGDGPLTVEAVAFVGAMTAELVEDAAARGALLYVTGQIRGPAIEAVHRCGIRALAVGQGRAEAWGLRRLSALVRERWPGVEVVDAGRAGR
jgi:putative NIF3 family GTP cyclohydrolase 1 type 2